MATVTQQAGAFGNRHVLTPEEGATGAATSARNRKNLTKYLVRTQKQLEKMHIEGETLKEFLKFAETLTLTPVGSIVVSWLLVDLLDKIHWIDDEEALELKTLVTSVEVLGALGGGQGLAGVVGALAKVGAG